MIDFDTDRAFKYDVDVHINIRKMPVLGIIHKEKDLMTYIQHLFHCKLQAFEARQRMTSELSLKKKLSSFESLEVIME